MLLSFLRWPLPFAHVFAFLPIDPYRRMDQMGAREQT